MSERVSVVVPVYNEAPVIESVLDEIASEILDRLPGSELVVVDDHSSDETPRLLDSRARADGRVRVCRCEQNRGHGPAVATAVTLSTGAWVFHLDSDGQVEARDFWTLWERRADADLLLGVRADRRDPRHRLLLTSVVNGVVSALAGRRVRDANVPLKLFRREVWDDVAPFMPSPPLAPSILLATGASVRSWRLIELPVTHRARTRGRSSLRALRLLMFSLHGLHQLFAFRLALARAPRRAAATVEARTRTRR